MAAQYVAAVFLVAAVVFAFIRAFQPSESIDFGWLAIGCLIVAVWLLPTLLAAGRLTASAP